MHKSKRTIDQNSYTTEKLGFGFNDDKGRQIGVVITRFNAKFEAADEDARSWYRQEPGDYFGVTVHAARNGVGYGASQPYQYFASEAGREAYVAKRVAATRKSYAKKFEVA
jgi:hypothetical protein